MKASLLRSNITVALILSVGALSAQIPNGGFENWVDQGGYIQPVGWLTYNDVITTGGPLASVEQGTPGFPGTYHCVITSRAVPSGSPIQGWISAGSTTGEAGFPYTQRPAMLTGQWQYGVQPGDTAEVFMALSKWNSTTSNTEAIAFGTLHVTGNLGTWQAFSVPLEYISTVAPDTAYIQIVSSVDFYQPVVGSFVKVDDLAFVGTVGIGEVRPTSTLSVFPTPGTNHFTLSGVEGSLPPGLHTITIFDATGRMVLQKRTADERPVIDTEALPAGIYRITIRYEQGAVTGTTWMKER